MVFRFRSHIYSFSITTLGESKSGRQHQSIEASVLTNAAVWPLPITQYSAMFLYAMIIFCNDRSSPNQLLTVDNILLLVQEAISTPVSSRARHDVRSNFAFSIS